MSNLVKFSFYKEISSVCRVYVFVFKIHTHKYQNSEIFALNHFIKNNSGTLP